MAVPTVVTPDEIVGTQFLAALSNSSVSLATAQIDRKVTFIRAVEVEGAAAVFNLYAHPPGEAVANIYKVIPTQNIDPNEGYFEGAPLDAALFILPNGWVLTAVSDADVNVYVGLTKANG